MSTGELQIEAHRAELTGFCYRMLGSAFDAEDAVQEAMVRAWKSLDRFEGRAALRSWLHRIATNVCVDMLNGRARRARPVDFGSPAAEFPAELGTRPPEEWIEPIPDARVMSSAHDPAELTASRESIRL